MSCKLKCESPHLFLSALKCCTHVQFVGFQHHNGLNTALRWFFKTSWCGPSREKYAHSNLEFVSGVDSLCIPLATTSAYFALLIRKSRANTKEVTKESFHEVIPYRSPFVEGIEVKRSYKLRKSLEFTTFTKFHNYRYSSIRYFFFFIIIFYYYCYYYYY